MKNLYREYFDSFPKERWVNRRAAYRHFKRKYGFAIEGYISQYIFINYARKYCEQYQYTLYKKGEYLFIDQNPPSPVEIN